MGGRIDRGKAWAMRWYVSFLVVAQILSAGSALAQGAGQERRTALIIGNSQIHVATPSGMVYAFGFAMERH